MTSFILALALYLAPAVAESPRPAEQPAALVTGRSRVDEVRYRSTALGKPASYLVYLPPGYEAGTARYPLVVLLHGLGGEPADWFTPDLGDLRRILDAMIGSSAIAPFVAVAPNGLDGYWTDHVSRAPGTAWGTFIGEVVAHAEARLRLDDRRAIVGASMGGHGAMSEGLMHPDRYRAIVSMAGALFPDPPTHRPIYKRVWGDPPDLAWFDRTAPLRLLRAWPRETPLPALWLHCGKKDGDRFLDGTLAADALLSARGIPHTLRLSDGGHGWTTWRSVARDWLSWLDPILR